jgi:hypothetical protein
LSMSTTTTVTFPNQPMADGAIPALWIGKPYDYDNQKTITDCGATAQWLSSLNSPLTLTKDSLRMTLHWYDYSDGPTHHQTQEILEAMANLMVVVSRVGYEMAQARHEGGEG